MPHLTSMAAASAGLQTPGLFESRWIISRKDDLSWFIGSSLTGYFALALMAMNFPIAPIYLLWMLGIDGPHVLATVTRTYFDALERKKLGPLLWVIVPAMVVGPVAVLFGQTSLFLLVAVSWQHFHIAKQHFGFVMLYKAKNGERDRTDFVIDRYFLLSSTLLPLLHFVLVTQQRLSAILPFWDILLAAYLILGVVFAGRQIQKARAGIPLNIPKLLLFVAVVPLEWLAFRYAEGFGASGIIRAGIVAGLFHSLQYHRLLWFHNANRYSDAHVAMQAGLAGTLSRHVLYYAAAAIGLNLILVAIPALMSAGNDIIQTALWGIPFTHYILDSKIWRVRGDRQLAAALHI
jgi:hypothetical protein